VNESFQFALVKTSIPIDIFWNITSFSRINIKFQITLSDYSTLNLRKEKEELEIYILEPKLFKRSDYEDYTLQTTFLSINATGLEDQNSASTVVTTSVSQTANIGTTSALVLGVAGGVLSGAAMTVLWSMINTLQMIEFLSLLSLNMPSFTLNILKSLQVTSFNIIPFDTIYESLDFED